MAQEWGSWSVVAGTVGAASLTVPEWGGAGGNKFFRGVMRERRARPFCQNNRWILRPFCQNNLVHFGDDHSTTNFWYRWIPVHFGGFWLRWCPGAVRHHFAGPSFLWKKDLVLVEESPGVVGICATRVIFREDAVVFTTSSTKSRHGLGFCVKFCSNCRGTEGVLV